MARFPQGIFVEGIETPAAPKENTEDDFFESWSKPSTPKPSAPSTPRISTPPILGRTPSPVTPASSSTSIAAPAPRTTTSSAAARTGKIGATRLNSAASIGSGPKKSKLGLGASKAAKPIDFEEAERKAREEAERIKQLGYDRQREAEEEKVRKEAEAKMAALEIGNKTVSASVSAAKKVETPKSASFPRFGFGAIPSAGAAAAVVQGAKSKCVHLPSLLTPMDLNVTAAPRMLSTMHPRLLVINLAIKRASPQTCILGETLMIPRQQPRLKIDYNLFRAHLLYPPASTLAETMKMSLQCAEAIVTLYSEMEAWPDWSLPRGMLCHGLWPIPMCKTSETVFEMER